MVAVGLRAHVEDGGHRAEVEFAVEMREQFVVARTLPAQGIAERVGIDRDQEQTGLSEIMLPRRLRDLGGGREMNIAVAQIDGTALEDALPFGLAPGRGGTDFVDRRHSPGVSCLLLLLLGFFPEMAGSGADRKGRRGVTQAPPGRRQTPDLRKPAQSGNNSHLYT